MNEPRIPARESGKALLAQACRPVGRGVGEGQVKKRDRIRWSERTNRHVQVERPSVSWRAPEPAWARNVLRIWKEGT